MAIADLSNVIEQIFLNIETFLNQGLYESDMKIYISDIFNAILGDNFFIYSFFIPIKDVLEVSIFVLQMRPYKGIVLYADCAFNQNGDGQYQIGDINFYQTKIKVDDKPLMMLN